MSYFLRRALLYIDCDRRLSVKTRFFGAAALTNLVLHEWSLCRIPPVTLRHCTCSFLSALGAALEPQNIRRSMHIAGDAGGVALDRRLVREEQQLVEEFIARSASDSLQGCRLASRQMDSMLNAEGLCRFLVSTVPSAAIYCSVLRILRSSLGRRIRFGLQQDRECIGIALTGWLRSSGGLLTCSGEWKGLIPPERIAVP